jgi:site-specific DNA recombinase
MVAVAARNVARNVMPAAVATTVQAIGYVRRSTNRQEESLEQQREKLSTFARTRGWELVAIYADDAISGSQMHRPGLESLIQHAERAHDVGIVLAWERNRLARPKDPVDGLLLERRLIQAGKRVYYVATGQEADRSFTSGLVGFVEHYQNGDYLRKLSRDAMRGMVARAQRGFWPCGMVPFGYDRLCLGIDGTPRRIIRNLPDRTQLLLHPETQEVLEQIRDGFRYKKPNHETVTLIPSEPARVEAVRKLFADYLAGVPFRVLRDTLNAQGMRSVSGDIFTIATLHTILRNPAYKGTLMFNRKTKSKWHRFVGGAHGHSTERQDEGFEQRQQEDWIVVEDAWPALVDAATFEAVQAKLRESHDKHHFVTGRSVRAGYLLSGTMTCAVCGGHLIGQSKYKHRVKPTTCRKYLCGTHHKGDHTKCPTRYVVPANVVEGKVWEYIKADLAHLKGDKQLHKYVAEELAKLNGGKVDAKKALQTRLADLDCQIAKLTTHLSVLDMQTANTLGLYAKAKTLAEERAQVQGQLDEVAQEVPDLPSSQEIAARADAALTNLDKLLESGSLEEQRELVRTYVKGIKVDPATQTLELSVMPALFSRIVTGDKVKG